MIFPYTYRALFPSILLGLLVGAIQLAVAFRSFNPPPNVPQSVTLARLGVFQSEIFKWKARQGTFPTAQELEKADITLTDGWRNPLHYVPGPDSFDLHSLGADGLPGGRGPGADIYLDERNANERKYTFAEYIHTEAGNAALLICIATAAVATLAFCLRTRRPLLPPVKTTSRVIKIAITLALTLVFTWFLITMDSGIAGSTH